MKNQDLYEDREQVDDEEDQDRREESNTNIKQQQQQTKKYMPPQFHKAKRTLTQLVTQYFAQLKQQISKRGAKVKLNKARIEGVQTAVMAYVSVRYGDRKDDFGLDLKLPIESKKKVSKTGILSYLSQCQKIINFGGNGKMNIINIDKNSLKLPDIATPIPNQNTILFLDPCSFDPQHKIFVPTPPAFQLTLQGKIKSCPPPILFRSKCAITKDKQFVYLLGGYATQNKILTNRCQMYNFKTGDSQQLPEMLHRHNCPTACILSGNIWVFSRNYLEYFDFCKWTEVPLPFGGYFLPFQFTIPINESQILLFGGMSNNEKSSSVKVYNIKQKWLNNYGQLLPQGICNQRSWGPCILDGCVAVLSSIQASIYPQVGVKSSMSQVIYILQSSAYLNSIITV